ncbi:MAG: hypothetical protein LBQ00_07360 [Syntrophobacterales bacterium]|jgi:hypothetical protein|nr:hypothetical protein [Syntrophobacterales bacterium]
MAILYTRPAYGRLPDRLPLAGGALASDTTFYDRSDGLIRFRKTKDPLSETEAVDCTMEGMTVSVSKTGRVYLLRQTVAQFEKTTN